MTLKELLATEPYASMDDASAAAAIDAATVDTWRDIEWLDVQMWCNAVGLTRAALSTASTTGSDANRTAAQYVLDVITAGQPMHATDERVRDVIAASSLTTAQKQALVALAAVTVPLYTTLDGFDSAPTVDDVAHARAG